MIRRRLELIQYSPDGTDLTYMVRDMAVLMDDERLQSLVDGYTTRFPQYYWLRMVYSESGQAGLAGGGYQDGNSSI